MDRRSARRLLLGILLVAAGLRFGGIFGAGYPFSFYPDEINNVERAVNFYSGEGKIPVDLNPRWFNKPALGYYVNFFEFGLYYAWGRYVTGDLTGSKDFADRFMNYERGPFYVIGRASNCIFALLTLVSTYRIGRRLGGRRVGLLSAGVLAISVGHVAWSQVVKHDVLATFFATLAMGWVLKVARKGRARDYALAGLCTGFGVATKYTPAAVAAVLLLAHVLHRGGDPGIAWWRRHRRLALGLGLVVVGFFLGSPYNFLDPTWYNVNVRSSAGHLWSMVFGAGGVDPSEATVLGQMLKALRVFVSWHGFTIPMTLVALFGLPERRSGRPGFVVLLVAAILALVSFLAVASPQNPRPNHVLLVYPLVSVLAARGLLRIASALRRIPAVSAHRRLASAAALALACLPGFPLHGLWLHLRTVYTPHPYARAAGWVQNNVPGGATVVNDGEILPLVSSEERLEWITERIRKEREIAARRLAELHEHPEPDNEAKLEARRQQIVRWSNLERKYAYFRDAAPGYPFRRYDVIVFLKPWQTEEGDQDKRGSAGYNDLWSRWPLAIPLAQPTPPVARLRVEPGDLPDDVEAEDRRRYPILPGRPAAFLISSEASYDNYDKPKKRENFRSWADFYDDLREHYDCVLIPGDRRRLHWSGWNFLQPDEEPEWDEKVGTWSVRIWDLTRRVEERAPRVSVADSQSCAFDWR